MLKVGKGDSVKGLRGGLWGQTDLSSDSLFPDELNADSLLPPVGLSCLLYGDAGLGVK